MRRSKMELYVDVLRALNRWGPLKQTHIMYKANLSSVNVKEFMDLFIEEEIIEKQTTSTKRAVYTITDKGKKILKVFRELRTILPEETANKKTIPALLY